MDFTAYISGLPPDKRSLLYRSPWTCLAVFRNLPPLAQLYVMRLLFVPGPFPSDYLDSWARRGPSSAAPPGAAPANSSQHRAALAALRNMDVLYEQPQQQQQQYSMSSLPGPGGGGGGGGGCRGPFASRGGGGGGWVLHADFQAQLQRVVCQGSMMLSGDVPAAAASSVPTLDQLGEWATRQWEALQLYLLGATRTPPGLPPLLRSRSYPDLDLRSLMIEAGLLAVPGGPHGRGGAGTGAGGLAVTQRGFHFLLQPAERQLWAILREYISGAEAASGEELASSLSFLLQLGFRRVGQPCPWAELRPQEGRMAAHLVQLGLLAVFQAADGSLYYTPTRLAASLCGAGGGGAGGGGAVDREDMRGAEGGRAGPGVQEAYIIVESNYRVYAYTRSAVTIAVLELFVRREALLPNLFVGAIRRDSILSALTRGISADELVSYLAARPHPSVASRSPVVPEVVSDQIRLWEASMNRLRADAAVLYENMESRDLYERAVSHARSAGTLLWEDNCKMRFVALDSGHEDMKGFIVRAKQDLKI